MDLFENLAMLHENDSDAIADITKLCNDVKQNLDNSKYGYELSVEASNEIINKLKTIGIDGEVIDGYVRYDKRAFDYEDGDKEYDKHAWVSAFIDDEEYCIDVTLDEYSELISELIDEVVICPVLAQPDCLSYDEPDYDYREYGGRG